MNIIAKILLACCLAAFLPSTVCAEKFNTLEDASKLAQRIMPGGDYIYDKNWKFVDRSDDLHQLIIELDAAITADKNNPVYWLLRGLARRKFISINRGTKWRNFTREQYFSNPVLISILEKSEQDYQKAIELDKKPDAPMHLTYDMLTAVVGRDTLLSAKATEHFTKRVFESYPSNNRQIVENSYGAMYAAYVKESRFADAERIINDMEKALARFYTKQQLNDFISKYRDAIENVKLEAAATRQEKKQAVTEPSLVAPEVAQQPPQADTKGTTLRHPVNQGSTINLQQFLLILAGIVLLGAVVLYWMRKKKH